MKPSLRLSLPASGLLLIFFYSLGTFARTIEVKYGKANFVVVSTSKKLIYRNGSTEIRLGRLSCQKKITLNFHKKLENLDSRLPMIKGTDEDKVNYSWNGKWFQENPKSVRGVFLTSLPFEMERVNRLAQKKCGKKP